MWLGVYGVANETRKNGRQVKSAVETVLNLGKISVCRLVRIALGLAPQVFNADQALPFQPRIRQRLLQRWGSRQVPVAVAADAMLDCCLQAHAQVQQVPNLRARPAPLFSYDITCLQVSLH